MFKSGHIIRIQRCWTHKQATVISYGPKCPQATALWGPHVIFSFPSLPPHRSTSSTTSTTADAAHVGAGQGAAPRGVRGGVCLLSQGGGAGLCRHAIPDIRPEELWHAMEWLHAQWQEEEGGAAVNFKAGAPPACVLCRVGGVASEWLVVVLKAGHSGYPKNSGS
jgi:hypothetical protein